MNQIKVPIKGMHCKSCEVLIEEKLGGVAGVKEVKASCQEGAAEICYDGERPEAQEIEKGVRAAGYEIGENEKSGWLAKDKSAYKDLGLAVLLVFGVYLILNSLGVFNLNIGAGRPSGLGIVFLIGLAAGVSTCMALVGGLVLSASAKYALKHPDSTPLQKFRPHLFFNFGRVFGFAFLGGVLGFFGEILEISTLFSGAFIVAVGLVMAVLGLQLTGISPKLNNFSFTIPKGIGRAFGLNGNEKEYSHRGSFIAGALTFFLPCGFTQAMQMYALSSGDLFAGAAIMGVFALGTTPGLLGVGGLTSLIKKNGGAKRFFKFVGVAVICLAVFNIANGAKLTGLNFSLDFLKAQNNNNEVENQNATSKDEVQVVRMTEEADGYFPNKFTVKKGVPVKWVIDAKAPYSCAAALVVPKLKIRKFLQAGENVIEFTPTQTGRLAFSCSMGMYTGAFTVID